MPLSLVMIFFSRSLEDTVLPGVIVIHRDLLTDVLQVSPFHPQCSETDGKVRRGLERLDLRVRQRLSR
jgi:hypothetical protein